MKLSDFEQKALTQIHCPARDMEHLLAKKGRFIGAYRRFYKKEIKAKTRYERKRFGPILENLYRAVVKG
mgnify:CR=1 FL=1